ncbi:MAG: hypothetical protein HY319_13980 [Armatimonadetes bacterium]|nr:hypothetical protein [Armatimonadota bacterium]
MNRNLIDQPPSRNGVPQNADLSQQAPDPEVKPTKGRRWGLQMLEGSAFWIVWDNGCEALSALDEGLDGRLQGRELDHLFLWKDKDSGGRSQRDERLGLEELGILELSCRYRVHERGFPYNPAGVRYRDGRTGPSYDWVPTSGARRASGGGGQGLLDCRAEMFEAFEAALGPGPSRSAKVPLGTGRKSRWLKGFRG